VRRACRSAAPCVPRPRFKQTAAAAASPGVWVRASLLCPDTAGVHANPCSLALAACRACVHASAPGESARDTCWLSRRARPAAPHAHAYQLDGSLAGVFSCPIIPWPRARVSNQTVEAGGAGNFSSRIRRSRRNQPTPCRTP
jgi:hypothetical protein